MRILPRNAWVALPLVWLGFVGLTAVLRKVFPRNDPARRPAWQSQAALKITLVVLALAAAAVEGLHPAQLGFRRPEVDVWQPAVAGGLLLGALATAVILSSGLRGLRSSMAGYSFVAIVFWAWIVSSVSEEIFCRGWFQTSTAGASSGMTALLPSALLFGGMHLTLFLAGVDVASVIVIVAATFALGLLTAWARAISGSLYPAIGAHVAFNVGGVLAGVVYAVGHRVVRGRFPSP